MLKRLHRPLVAIAGLTGAVLILSASPRGATVKFFPDDPIPREPASQDASNVQPWDIDLFWDLSLNMFTRPGDPAVNVKAGNVNTIDEVPDSSWFTNRIGVHPVSVEEATRGPLAGSGPAPGQLTIIAAKEAGVAPGFTVRDTKGEMWFVSFDGKGFPEAATGAILVANKLFWALGYWQVENHPARIDPSTLVIDPAATFRPPSGNKRAMKMRDVEEVLRRAHRSPDGTYRAVAARLTIRFRKIRE